MSVFSITCKANENAESQTHKFPNGFNMLTLENVKATGFSDEAILFHFVANIKVKGASILRPPKNGKPRKNGIPKTANDWVRALTPTVAISRAVKLVKIVGATDDLDELRAMKEALRKREKELLAEAK